MATTTIHGKRLALGAPGELLVDTQITAINNNFADLQGKVNAIIAALKA